MQNEDEYWETINRLNKEAIEKGDYDTLYRGIPDKSECEARGGEFVHSYIKADGTKVEGYCRTKLSTFHIPDRKKINNSRLKRGGMF